MPGEEAARWRAIIESAVDGIVVIDSHGILEAFNPAAERLFGYKESEVLGKNVSILMPSPHKEEHNSYIENYLRTGQPKIIGRGREVSARKRDGTLFPIHLAVGEMNVGCERKFTGIIHDLSARVEMERRLREQAAMARLGEMAAVIAHEVKNPLAGIRGAIQVVGSRLPKDGREAQIMKEVVARIDALNDLMKDLLLFARPPQPKPMTVDLASLVRSTAMLVKADPGHAGVDIIVEGEAPPVPADAELLKIVFLNLLVNAAHAMQGQGTIRVSLSAEDSTCRVVVADKGPGIPPEIREKVFTPFFTTKARGTGLGLVTARRLIEAHAGTISIDCPEDGGTRVTIELPVSR
jgi:two-component system sensor kinase FixL